MENQQQSLKKRKCSKWQSHIIYSFISDIYVMHFQALRGLSQGDLQLLYVVAHKWSILRWDGGKRQMEGLEVTTHKRWQNF